MILIPENINNITQQLVESLQQLKSDLEITVNSSKITYIKRTIENPKTRKEHNIEPYNIAKYNNKFISKVIEKLEIALGNTLIMEEIEITGYQQLNITRKPSRNNGLKSFEQLQAEYKTASVVQFANSSGILGRLFKHQILDLQVLCWASLNPLQYPVKLRVNTLNNFLAGVVCIFLDNKLSLDNRLPCAFHSPGRFPMALVLGDPLYFNVVCSLKIVGVAYSDQLLDKNGFIASAYLNNCLHAPSPASLASVCASVLDSTSFANICDEIDVYTDGSLRSLGTFQMACGAAVYFPSLNKGLEVEAVALALECISVSVSVALHMDKRRHVVNLIESKDLTVHWIKVKGYAGIAGNVLANVLAEQTAHSGVSLSARINYRYVVADDRPVSGNACHFVRDIFCSICKFQWEVGPGQRVVSCLFGLVVDWNSTALVWHPDFHMLSGSMCQATAALHTYFMKAVHFRLPVVVRKKLYNKVYSGVSCLFCGDVELPDHGFTCVKDASVQLDILGDFGGLWRTLMNLSLGVSDVGLYSVFCKGFVLKSWMDETTASLGDKKKAAIVVVDFICCLAKSHRMNLWLFRTKFRSDMKRSGLIGDDVFVASALGMGALPLSVSTVYLIGVLDSLDVSFGFRSRFLFLSGAVHRVSVSISA
ncbi:hypothetical protein G9A89_020032 [Geosiphon pyriformis]|nr:hypothetical protein G9A89_020032 [Geosiphon pyriformis]